MEALPRRTLFLITNCRIPISRTLRLQIAHFSTNQSPSHYPYRRHEEEVRNVGVSVWWDVEICSPPAGSGAFRIVHSITAALRANGIRGPLRISAFGNVLKIPKLTQEALSSTGINLTHVPAGRNNSVSNSMIIELMYWVSQHPPPVHLLLISGNHDMAGILHRLRMSNYNILLAGPEDASTALFSAASIMWSWSDLLRGENLTGKHFNHPPDGPSGSWYGSYRVPLESPFPDVDQPMDARDGEPVESETENTISDIPIDVVEQIRQILILYPKGLSIAVLREELNKSMTLDKNLYGYKKFSNLLFAMPQIIELRHRKNGQHLVCINPKEQLSADSLINASKNSIAGDCTHKTPSTETEVCDDSSSLKSAGEIANQKPHLITNGKSKMIEMDHASPAMLGEKPSLKMDCQDHCPTSEMDVEVKTISCDPAAIEKQDNASEHGVFGRTWTKWLGGMSDMNMTREGNHSVQNSPSFDSSHNDTTTEKKPEIPENFDIEIGRIQKLYSRVLNWFKTDRSEIESSAAGSNCSNISSQVAQDKPGDSDLQKQIECAIESTNQSPAPKASLEFADEKKTRMLADCQKLLDAILKTHRNGYDIRRFKNLFFERYCYRLDVNYLEFDKLASLINTMSGVKLKVTLKGTMIFPSENSSPNPGSSKTGLLDNIDRVGVRTDSDSVMSIPSTNSDSYDSQFDEQLGPVRSLNGNLPSGQSGGLKPRTDKKLDRLYKPCSEEDIYTDSDGETQTQDGKGVPKVHNEVSTLMDIISNWEAGKDGASKSKLSEVSVKDSLQNPTKPHSPVEVSRKSSRNIVQKWKPQRTFNFVASDHRKEVDFKSATEPRQQC